MPAIPIREIALAISEGRYRDCHVLADALEDAGNAEDAERARLLRRYVKRSEAARNRLAGHLVREWNAVVEKVGLANAIFQLHGNRGLSLELSSCCWRMERECSLLKDYVRRLVKEREEMLGKG